jgi:chromosome segregation ATPase
MSNFMQERLKRRLEALKAEFDRGQKQLSELEAQATSVRNTLLRISGAIQVLEEELAKESQLDGNGELRSTEMECSTAAKVPSNA